MCGNAGPHMPWHSCRGERTTFGISGHCPLCFRQSALCLYHCRCRNSWPVSFQDCRLCSHLGAALGSTQGCCVLLCINSDNWSSGAHVYTASTASKEPSLQSSLLLETWSHKDGHWTHYPPASALIVTGITGVHQHTGLKSRAFCCYFVFWERMSFCSSFWLGIWYVVQAGLIETLVPQSPKSCITGVSQHTQQKF